jgi:hypothetical protein
MTSHVGRLYALALALVVFFLAWAVVAARPWASATTTTSYPSAQLRREAKLVNAIVAARSHTKAAAVRVVNLPPITITRTS